MIMSQRLSMVAGTISFVAVAVLSALSLDMVEGEGFFMQGLFTVESSAPAENADSPEVEGDSTRGPSTEKPCRRNEESSR
jgi:hypothetical protein